MLEQIEKMLLAEPLEHAYQELEALLMRNIIRHVVKYDQLIASDDWLLQKLAEIGKLNQENIKLIAETAGKNQPFLQEMLDKAVDTVMDRIEPGMEKLEKEKIIRKAVIPKKSKNIQEAMKALYAQAKDALNLCNTHMLYMSREAYKTLVTSVAEKEQEYQQQQKYLDILNKHTVAEATGSEARQQAIREAIREFNEKGIPGFIDKRGRKWTPEAYVSMTLRTTSGNMGTEAMFARMQDRNLSLFKMSTHPGSRPKCAKDQGKIFDRNNGSGYTTDLKGNRIRYYPLNSSSYGEPDGMFGINCGHHGTPWIPGVSVERYFPTEDEKKNEELYKKMQTQRAYERQIRKDKRLLMMYKESDDEAAFQGASEALKRHEAKLDDFVTKQDLTRRRDREEVIGFEKKTAASANAKAQKRYKEWAKSVGAESGPETLAGYYKMKYNDDKESRLYKGYLKAVKNGSVSPLVGYDTYQEVAQQAEKALTGKKTAQGQEIQGITVHLADRIIGQYEDSEEPRKGKRKGVKLEDVVEAICNGEAGPVIKRKDGRLGQLFYGKNCQVSYNPEEKVVVQVSPGGKKK